MYNSCRGIKTVSALKADFSAKVRECVTSLSFLHWFVSNEPVFGHRVLVLEEGKAEELEMKQKGKDEKKTSFCV